jgi:rhombotail lipoprotein
MNVLIGKAVGFTVAAALAGCASWMPQGGTRHTGSAVDYLYPDAREAPRMQESMATLRPPVRVGIAFAPGSAGLTALPESERIKLLERVRAAFSKHAYIGAIEIIPSQYLRPKGGFANLDQATRMLNVDIVALLSYDQVQFTDSNKLSLLYWTIVGAYVINGDQYDIQTMVDAAVFDVASRKLLLRAPGTSQVKGGAPLMGFTERARAARQEGYDKAVDNLIPQLQAELDRFRERIKTDASVRVVARPGSGGGGAGSLGWWGLLLALMIMGTALRNRG